ncbi:OsmC family protein [Oharaeibacter diazotrophicus]|uniref:Putative OsmC-like protein n=1 Tax=Oharaeibacter diazotrophicus TaxID=1920512 RepID=A0A4R6R8Y9_9HYPH|nr:OsmC family protein [Oharaeibacter diazotrophicus]TDP82412.1 putative OsmC-like protein [Oharaeibacter diazotrophicus]BBE72825.1 OsmC-like protein [Pleomorphomonas sp. SM30]GLS76863.1 hypothetical protein GCM10007904_22000 [Oharaeibacter diazotrophicus]
MKDRLVTVAESGNGPYGQVVTAGRHVFGADEPEAVGGRDTGPDPFELVMAGLGACTAMTVRMYAERKGWAVRKVTVTLRHARRVGADGRDTDVFERVLDIDGDLDAAQRDRLVEIAAKCPVGLTLGRGSEVVTRLAGPAADAAV